MSIFKFTAFGVLGAFAAFASACSRDASPRIPMATSVGDAADSTFIVQTPITLVRSQPVTSSAFWSLPTLNSMTFKACLADIAKIQPIIGQTFVVRSDVGEQRVVTDPAGCITWNESVNFNYLQDETYVQSEHWIVGEDGPYRGTRHLPLAIDPWSATGDALIDLRQGEKAAPKLAQGTSMVGALLSAKQLSESSASPIVIPSIVLQSNDIRFSGDSASVTMRMIMKPTVSRRNLTNAMIQEPLHNGEFRLSISLIERNRASQDDQLIVLAEKTDSVTLAKDEISVDLPLVLKHKPAATSIIELAFDLEPVSAPVPLLPVQGRAQLAGLEGRMEATVVRLDGSYSDYMKKASADTAAFQQQARAFGANASCSDGSDQLGYFLKSIQVDNMGVTARTQNENVPSEILTGYTVCLQTTTDRVPVTDHVFEVRLNGAPKELKTDVNGCFRFTEPVSFDYFASEGWVGETLHVTSRQAPFENVTREFPVWINPWAAGDQFFWDCRRGEKPAYQTRPARLEMIDFGYTFLGRELEIDSSLNLTLKRRYQFQITPRLVRSKGYSGLVGYETVNDARYHMRVLMLSPKENGDFSKLDGATTESVLKNFKFLSSYEADVQARDGRIVEEVDLPVLFQEMPLLAGRNAILVQLAPMDPSSSLVSQPFYSPFLASLDYGLFGLVEGTSARNSVSGERMGETGLDLEKLMEIGSRSKDALRARGSKIADMIEEFHLVQPSQGELEAVGISAENVKSLFSSAKVELSAAKKLCHLLKGRAGSLEKCLAKPFSEIETVRTQHVEAIEGRPEVVDSKYLPMTVTAALSVSDSNTDSQNHGVSDATTTNTHGSVDAKVGGGIDFFGFFKAGADVSGGKGWSKGKMWFDSTQTTLAKTATGTATVSFARNFGIEQLSLAIRAGVRQCMTVRLKKSKSSGLLICENEVSRSKQLTESYYLISELLGSPAASLRDPRSDADMPWIKAIRGKAAFNAIESVLTDRSKALILDSTHVNESGLEKTDDTLDDFARSTPKFSDGAFPSVIY